MNSHTNSNMNIYYENNRLILYALISRTTSLWNLILQSALLFHQENKIKSMAKQNEVLYTYVMETTQSMPRCSYVEIMGKTIMWSFSRTG